MKILILGQNPSRLGRNCPSLKKLDEWLDTWNLGIVSFDNVQQDYGRFINKKVDDVYIKSICEKYDRIITLGNNPGTVLSTLGIYHFSMPHPSPLNRKLNDSSFELMWVNMAKIYIQEGF